MNKTAFDRLGERLIALLRTQPDRTYGWEELARELKTERPDIEQAARVALSWEYELEIHPLAGLAFVAAPDALIETEISHDLNTEMLGRKLACYKSVKSTNDIASRLAASGAPDGTIVTAEQQTAGRGRLGRNWHSPPRTGIYLSVVLRPDIPPENAPGLSVATAVALADTFAAYSPGRVQIKWPNDVFINSRKAAGILCELTAERRRVNYLVVGVGINVNHQKDDFPPDLRDMATSLCRELGDAVNRVELLKSFLRHLEREYGDYCQSGLAAAHDKVHRYSFLLGREVTVESGRCRITGQAMEIDARGCLVLATSDGPAVITAGDVTVVKG